MITVTRLNKSQVVVNADMIKTLEATPDTVITLDNDEKFIVSDPVDVIIEMIVTYRRRLYSGLLATDTANVNNSVVKDKE